MEQDTALPGRQMGGGGWVSFCPAPHTHPGPGAVSPWSGQGNATGTVLSARFSFFSFVAFCSITPLLGSTLSPVLLWYPSSPHQPPPAPAALPHHTQAPALRNTLNRTALATVASPTASCCPPQGLKSPWAAPEGSPGSSNSSQDGIQLSPHSLLSPTKSLSGYGHATTRSRVALGQGSRGPQGPRQMISALAEARHILQRFLPPPRAKSTCWTTRG